MSVQTDQILADLEAAKQSNLAIKADIQRLNDTIQSATTLEELTAIQTASAELAASLQATDDLTPEA